MSVKTLSKCELPDPAAQTVAEERYRDLAELGIKARYGWDRRAPSIDGLDGAGVSVSSSYWIPHVPGLIDHPYRLIYPDGRVVFASEPYEVSEWEQLVEAERQGWDVSIDSWTLWYPGRTVRIVFERAKADR